MTLNIPPPMRVKNTSAPANWLSVVVDFKGQTMTAEEWCTHLGLKPRTVYMRRLKGYTWAEAFNTENTRVKARRSFFPGRN